MDWFRRNGKQRQPRPLLCCELDCIFHDGDGCGFPWIEKPSHGEMRDRGICRNFIIEEGNTLLARINSIY